jgi:hypothetical protein
MRKMCSLFWDIRHLWLAVSYRHFGKAHRSHLQGSNSTHCAPDMEKQKGTKFTRWFKYDRDWLRVNKSQFVPVIFEPPCIYISSFVTICHRLVYRLLTTKRYGTAPTVSGVVDVIRRFVGMRDQQSTVSPHRTVNCGLAGDRATLLGTPAHSSRLKQPSARATANSRIM